MARAFRGDHDHVVRRVGRDALVEDVEAVSEQDGGAGCEVCLDVLRVDLRLNLLGEEDRDELRAGDGVRNGTYRKPVASASPHEDEPSRRPTSTSTPESRRLSACACPWLP